jgi:hypothetical protein
MATNCPTKAELVQQWRDEKKEKRRLKNRKLYLKSKGESPEENPEENPKESPEESPEVLRQRKHREKKKDILIKRLCRREKKRVYREKRQKAQDVTACNDHATTFEYTSRMQKHRAANKLRRAMPATPNRRISALAAYLTLSKNPKSPTVDSLEKLNILKTASDRVSCNIAQSIVCDVKQALDQTKRRRSNDNDTARNVIIAAVSGQNVAGKRLKIAVAKQLGLPPRRMTGGVRLRTRVLTSEHSCWTVTHRKTKANALSEDHKKTAYNFWTSSQVSRPTGNKRDVKRERLGPKLYASHMVQVLEKTQTETYIDFKSAHPDIKMSQRSFESCKPFFVRAVRAQDRNTCCCRYHTEFKSLFTQCMSEREKIVKSKIESGVNCDGFPIYQRQHELVAETLCPKHDNEEYCNINCLERNCTECGVHKLQLLPEELDTSEARTVTWEKFEYVTMQRKGNKDRKKLMLVKKTTHIGEMFAYLQSLLSSFPAHQFRSQWQSEQLKSLLSHLPEYDCVCIHDFSENFRYTIFIIISLV